MTVCMTDFVQGFPFPKVKEGPGVVVNHAFTITASGGDTGDGITETTTWKFRFSEYDAFSRFSFLLVRCL